MNPEALPLDRVSRLPALGDNVAIATRRLEAGTILALPNEFAALPHTVLEGHRFAIVRISCGDRLLSWGHPFGTAVAEIAAGDYVCNQSMLAALGVREFDAEVSLPDHPNFADWQSPFHFDEGKFHPGAPVDRAGSPLAFDGYRRTGNRGVGTRNYVVVLGTSSRTGSFARELASRLESLLATHPGLDGIVAVAHTEGGGFHEPNNAAEILRCLAGFMVHPNVGAVLAVDHGVEPISNARLSAFMKAHGYPLDHVPHRFLTLRREIAKELAEAETTVWGWLPEVSAARRTAEPLNGLRIALQCGGSDAFSGVSGNPLAGAVVHELIRHGGTGVLTETDEAMGAESYLLRNVRDLATAHALLGRIESFRERLRWHGVSPESNPSAGNKFRGLYNITLKSLGAVHKKDPRTRLDFVSDYGEPIRDDGFHFMNGPGNDLEGVAGQIASGCNVVMFVTGNGSITNFPFVPTLKITTTTRRHELLRHEMDINAGRYLDGESMESLAAEAFETVIATASGRRTKGELAGHSQVSIWREWRQTNAARVAELKARDEPDGRPLAAAGRDVQPRESILATRTGSPFDRECRGAPAKSELGFSVPACRLPDASGSAGYATERVGLVLPTSLCAAQVARLAAERLNGRNLGSHLGLERFVALTHTEGCGFGGESMYRLLHRTYRGYATHPNVALSLLLEHGCEKIPNDAMRRQFEGAGISLDRFGWASVQLDGGIARVLAKIEAWFIGRLERLPSIPRTEVGLGALHVGMLSEAVSSERNGAVFGGVAGRILEAGGSVLIPAGDALLANPGFLRSLSIKPPDRATLAYGQPPVQDGFHVVDTETDHWVENVTGLVGSGSHAVIGLINRSPQPGHPLVPIVQVARAGEAVAFACDNVDVILEGDAFAGERAVLASLASVLRRERLTVANAAGLADFQLTRGLLGVTT